MNNDVEQIIKLIKEKRKEKKINQHKMSELLGITQSHYSNIESGNRGLSLAMFFKALNILGVDDFFKSKNDNNTDLVSVESQDVVSFFKSIINSISNISEIKEENQEIKQDIKDLKAMLQKLLEKSSS